ncbi:MAG: hypothetical protein HC838_03215 [Spirulinaceae cyanobacterium RM2_2_10]|nr:hypothetical protein [Spirulinaceae cyanobacterium SM2_1_0]NJO19266.1 hypothetical protein [Spirulinaceae cyanobacterium RM2_2_10]
MSEALPSSTTTIEAYIADEVCPTVIKILPQFGAVMLALTAIALTPPTAIAQPICKTAADADCASSMAKSGFPARSRQSCTPQPVYSQPTRTIVTNPVQRPTVVVIDTGDRTRIIITQPTPQPQVVVVTPGYHQPVSPNQNHTTSVFRASSRFESGGRPARVLGSC